jgi:ectoine hydroxylase-related dioxygenase (phytanoyl-CoA dioxygenase family)
MATCLNPSTSQKIKESFQQDGYYVAKGLFSGNQLSTLQVEFDRIVHQITSEGADANAGWQSKAAQELNGKDRRIIHTHRVEYHSSLYMKAFMDPEFLKVTEAILGPDIILHHSKLFMKPPKVGSGFPMHQDWGYFPTEKDSMIAAIIHLSDATDEMGALRMYPGSHNLGRQKGTMGGGNVNNPNPVLKDYPLENGTVLEAKAGDVVFFHYFTLHGSMPNDSDETRKTVLVQMHSGDDLPDKDRHLYSKVALQGSNSRLKRITE